MTKGKDKLRSTYSWSKEFTEDVKNYIICQSLSTLLQSRFLDLKNVELTSSMEEAAVTMWYLH